MTIMVVSFLRELREVWRRQHMNWRTVVTRQVFNRFFNQLTMQYSNIFIRGLGASALELGAVNSASGLGSTLISLPLGYLQDRYSIRKIYLLGISILTLSPLLYAVADRWELVVPAILIAGLCQRLGSCVIICDLSLPNEDRATGKRELRFFGGPVFAHVVLADEINRTPPKTQAALLEAMQEGQVTAAGVKHTLAQPFTSLGDLSTAFFAVLLAHPPNFLPVSEEL